MFFYALGTFRSKTHGTEKRAVANPKQISEEWPRRLVYAFPQNDRAEALSYSGS